MPNLDLHGFGQKYRKGGGLQRRDLNYVTNAFEKAYNIEQSVTVSRHSLEHFHRYFVQRDREYFYITYTETTTSYKSRNYVYKYSISGELIWRIELSVSRTRTFDIFHNHLLNILYVITEDSTTSAFLIDAEDGSVKSQLAGETGAFQVNKQLFYSNDYIFNDTSNFGNVIFDALTLADKTNIALGDFRIKLGSGSNIRDLIGSQLAEYKLGFVGQTTSFKWYYKEFDMNLNEIHSKELDNLFGTGVGAIFRDNLILVKAKNYSGSSSPDENHAVLKSSGQRCRIFNNDDIRSRILDVDIDKTQLRNRDILDFFTGIPIYEMPEGKEGLQRISYDSLYFSQYTLTENSFSLDILREGLNTHHLN